MENRIIIVGGGPAGIAAAIQLKRSGHDPLLIERNRLGGLLLNANYVENYPGFPNGISGLNLVKLFISQMNKISVKTMRENVISIEKFDNKYNIITGNMRELRCEHLILATGTKPARDNELLSGISEGIKEKIFYEPYVLFDESEKDICIIGGSDAAFDYAMSLSKKNRVFVFVRGKESRAVKRLVELVGENKKITIFYSTKVIGIDEFDSRLSVRTESGSEKIKRTFDFVVFAIGRQAEYPTIKDFENIKEEKNVYLIGDIKNGIYRQLSLSVADGMRASMTIDFKIRRIESESN